MSVSVSADRVSIPRLILIPSLITLAVTLLRLVGELQHWSSTWFNPEPGGPWSIVGIVWLVPIFGIIFALRLASAGNLPRSKGYAIGLAILGSIVFASGFFLYQNVLRSFMGVILMWVLAAGAAALQCPVWPRLFKTLTAYGYGARVPVALVMYLATERGWQSHYSARATPISGVSLLTQFLLFGFIPQLVWWVSFTVVAGSLVGTIAAALMGRKGPIPAAVK